jgi:Na+/H+-translocating membrane pyrophosphatase
MTTAWHAGVASGLVGGGPLGLITSVAAILSVGSYSLTVGHFAPVADSARGVSSMAHAAPEQQQRIRALDEAGAAGATVSQTFLILAGCLVALTTTLPLFMAGVHPRTDLEALPAIVFGGLLGATLVLFNAGSGLRSASRAARQVAAEVERQLRGFPRERAVVHVPEDYTPSYRAVIDIVGRLALERSLTVPTLSALVPAAVGVGLGLLYRTTDPGMIRHGLTSYALAACFVGLIASLAFDAARATLGAARRATAAEPGSSNLRAAVSADAFADSLGKSAGPAAHLVARLSAVVCLALAPLIT